MDRDVIKFWRCPACKRMLREQDEAYARGRLEATVAEVGPHKGFVREALWPAYLAALRRCRCGSRRRLKAVPAGALRGQLDLHL